jgi:hypothetical protein
MKRVERETMRCKMFLVKGQKRIEKNDKEKEYMRGEEVERVEKF